jgi:hypothetical protein
VNTGEILKAIILKCFEGKAIEHLLGAGIEGEDLNDGKIGRVMDKLSKYGLTKSFLIIAL